MLLFNLLGFFNALDMHNTAFLNNEIVESASTIDPICFLELLSISQSIQKQEELWVRLGLVGRTRYSLHFLLILAQWLLHVKG